MWGFVSALLFMAAGVAHMLGGNIDIVNASLLLQEMVLACWLIVKGFNPDALAQGAPGGGEPESAPSRSTLRPAPAA